MISSAAEFVRLRTSDKQEKYERTHLEEAPHEVWLEVIRDYPDMREWVAHNRTVSVDILRMLATDENPRVRERVASKRKAHKTPDLLALFSQDSEPRIRLGVARSPHISQSILVKLSQDTDEWVRITAATRLAGQPVPDLPSLHISK